MITKPMMTESLSCSRTRHIHTSWDIWVVAIPHHPLFQDPVGHMPVRYLPREARMRQNRLVQYLFRRLHDLSGHPHHLTLYVHHDRSCLLYLLRNQLFFLPDIRRNIYLRLPVMPNQAIQLAAYTDATNHEIRHLQFQTICPWARFQKGPCALAQTTPSKYSVHRDTRSGHGW